MQITFPKTPPLAETKCHHVFSRDWLAQFIEDNAACPECSQTLSIWDITPISTTPSTIRRIIQGSGIFYIMTLLNVAHVFYSMSEYMKSDCLNDHSPLCPSRKLAIKSMALWSSWSVTSLLGSHAYLFPINLKRISGRSRLLINLGIISTTLANYLCLSETVRENQTAAPMVVYDLGLMTMAAGLILHDRHCHIRQLRLFGIFALSFGFMLLANLALWFHANDI